MIEKDEETSHWLGPQRPKEWHGGEFLSFVFVSYIQELDLKKLATWNFQWGQTWKAQQKLALSSQQDEDRGSLSRQKIFRK